MLYFESPNDKKPKRSINLINSRISELNAIKGHKFAFTLITSKEKHFQFSAGTLEEAEDWRNYLIQVNRPYSMNLEHKFQSEEEKEVDMNR